MVTSSTLLIISLVFIANGLNTCPNTKPSQYPPTMCPNNSSCCATPYVANGYGCTQPSIDDPDFNYCCFAGPSNLDQMNNKPNIMILGDSVSIGYTPYVVTNLSSIAYVQHSAWSSDGGSGSVTYGLSCLPIFLYSMNQSFINWDIIQFNFGLHDLDNSSYEVNKYKDQLTQITKILMEFNNGSAKLQFATTTPFMPAYNEGDYIVEELNDIARNIMSEYNIPIVDLYGTVVDICGPVPYINCTYCAKEPCSYHYKSTGYQYIAATVIEETKKQLDSLSLE